MNRTLKNTLIIAAAVAVIGLIIALIGFAVGGMQAIYVDSDGVKLASEDDNSHAVNEQYEKITSIKGDFDLRDIILKEGTGYTVESSGVGKDFQIDNNNGALVLGDTGDGGGFEFNLFGFINSGQYADIIITYPAGSTFENIDIDSDSGKITVNDLNANTVKLNSDLGDVVLSNVVVADLDTIIDSGKLEIEQSNINSLKFNLGLGDLRATGYTGKKISGKLDSGSAKLEGIVTGPITIEDGLGDVELTLGGKEYSYSYDLTTDLGDINLNGQESNNQMSKLYEGKPLIKINTDSGNIRIDFKS